MKVTIEVVADERDEIVTLVREAATKLARRKEESGKTVNYCMGDYRVLVEDDPDAPATTPDDTHEKMKQGIGPNGERGIQKA